MKKENSLSIDTLSNKERRRIFKKIAVDHETGCWVWTGALDQGGYGQVWFRGRTERIHRIIFAYYVGPVPRGIRSRSQAQLDHAICQNPSCCNPAHLELVTQRTNILRGTSPPALCSQKTHCVRGHPLKYTANGKRRYCPTCDSIRHKLRSSGPNREYWLEKSRQASRRYCRKRKNAG